MKRKNNWHVKFGLTYRNSESPLDGTKFEIDLGYEDEMDYSNYNLLENDSSTKCLEEASDDE